MSFEPHPDDLTETLKQFRTELIETRNLTIKTDNLIKNLSADVRQIGKRQEMGDKRWVFNSVMSSSVAALQCKSRSSARAK